MGFRSRSLAAAAIVLAAVVAASPSPASAEAGRSRTLDASAPRAAVSPRVWFEPNLGQADPRAHAVARTRDFVALLTGDGAVLRGASGTLGLRFVGARGRVVPADPLRGRSRYLTGNDPSKWLTDVPHHGAALLDEALPGIDVRWRGDEGALRFDVEVAPGADEAAARLALDGADRAWIDAASGRVVADLGRGRVELTAPVAWQERDGRREPLAARWTRSGDGTFGFSVPGRDPAARLVVDPTVHAGTFLGSTAADAATRVVTNVDGTFWLCGSTASSAFPVGPTSGDDAVRQTLYGDTYADPGFEISTDGFVAKISSDGVSLEWATYLGGVGDDVVSDLALDASGRIVLCGTTTATNFPLSNPIGTSGSGFLARLTADATFLLYSSYVANPAARVCLDAAGNAFVLSQGTGATVTKYDSSLRLTTWSATTTPTSGSGTVTGRNLALDASGDVWAIGSTNSATNTGLTTTSAFTQTYGGGANDAYVWRLRSSDGSRTYGGYFGGNGDDQGEDLAFDPGGRLVVCGTTTSSNFPLNQAMQSSIQGGRDGFVARLDLLVYLGAIYQTNTLFSTYLGGSGTDTPREVAVGPFSEIYVAGDTQSTTNFPLSNALQSTHAGGTNDAFVAKLSSAGTLTYSTYVGGSGDDTLSALVLGPAGRPTVCGRTTSSSLHLLSGALQTTNGGSGDAYVLAIEESSQPFGSVARETLTDEPTVGTTYNADQSVLPLTGGSTPLTWELHTGVLPAGLTLSGSGVLTGLVGAGAGGDHVFAVRVRDNDGAAIVREYTLRIWDAPLLTTAALAPWTIGRDMTQKLESTGGRPDVAWRLLDAQSPGGTGRLPGGLRFSLDGSIDGTPVESGDFTFGAEVRDANDVYSRGVVTFHVSAHPSIEPRTFVEWTEGRPYTASLTANDGTPPFTWSLDAGTLPTTVLESATGTLSGVTSAAGDHDFTIRLRDTAGAETTRAFSMRVNAIPRVLNDVLPPACIEREYYARLVSTDGTGDREWYFAGEGEFPVGLEMDGNTGELGGRPRFVRAYEIGVRVVDACGAVGTRAVSMDVLPFLAIDDPRRNAVVDAFAEGAPGAPVSRFIELLAGSRLDGTFRLVGRGKLGARLRFVDLSTYEDVDLTPYLKGRGNRLTLKNFTVATTKRFLVIVEPDEGFVGKVETNLRARAQSSFRGTVTVTPGGAPAEVVVHAKAGSLLTVTVKRAKGSAALPTIVGVRDAAGNELLTNVLAVKATKTGATLKLAQPLPIGAITLSFAPAPAVDPQEGACTWSAKLKSSSRYEVRLYDLPAGEAVGDDE